MAASSASTSRASASRDSLVVARRSRLNLHLPGTTLIEPFGTSSMPTVPTQAPATLPAALLDEEHQLCRGGSGVAPAVHRRRARVARHAGDLDLEAHAAVDRGDDAERQVRLVEHRPLLDVDLDEAEVALRVALHRADRLQRAGALRRLHRLAHRDAVGILLVEPGGVELADHRARAEEGGLVALAFLFREPDHLEAERQQRRLAARCSSRTQTIGTKMPSRPSYLPPLRTVS